jgi:hypothetical protein
VPRNSRRTNHGAQNSACKKTHTNLVGGWVGGTRVTKKGRAKTLPTTPFHLYRQTNVLLLHARGVHIDGVATGQAPRWVHAVVAVVIHASLVAA